MTTPATVTLLSPSIQVLSQCLERSSQDYQTLLKHSEAYSLCVEVGKSLRHLGSCYARVLCAALDYSELSDDDSDEVDEEAFELSDEDVDFE